MEQEEGVIEEDNEFHQEEIVEIDCGVVDSEQEQA